MATQTSSHLITIFVIIKQCSNSPGKLLFELANAISSNLSPMTAAANNDGTELSHFSYFLQYFRHWKVTTNWNAEITVWQHAAGHVCTTS